MRLLNAVPSINTQISLRFAFYDGLQQASDARPSQMRVDTWSVEMIEADDGAHGPHENVRTAVVAPWPLP